MCVKISFVRAITLALPVKGSSIERCNFGGLANLKRVYG
ncbi:hypothetical protein NSE_0405 [Neorickettsia sennetsu str. Miyayama]|uniref:Uncharacterized protein n=1 Tax=Ehrlichia sennetsu (strain ATCC VR-367 / Miyayama) TaxID=222891 RepID=Q2GE04_EHRS3|nr:hypothetical protein NSE_0405 [Neorickettsia sennetsu str. Miyayama]